MVKFLESQTNPSSRRLNLPIKLIIYLYKRLSVYIKSKNFDTLDKEQCPNIFVSNKYPRMSILELYQRINHHLIKYFPDIHQKLNSNNKKYIIKQKGNSNDNNKKSEKNINNINDFEKSNIIKEEKTSDIIIDIKNDNTLSEDIKLLNEQNCQGLNHLFKPHKFDDEICNKYNNCFVKEVLIKNDDNNIMNLNHLEINNNSNISPSKSTSSISSKYHKNKVNYLTYSKNFVIKKSKYFNFINI